MSGALPGSSAAPSYRIAPVADRHLDESRRMIEAAATGTAAHRVIVLGAGRCREIPLAWLAERFERVVLVDLDLAALDEGVAAARLPVELRSKLELRIDDLSGLTGALERPWRDELAGAANPTDAIERMAAAADAASAAARPPDIAALAGGPFDLVVASCLLSQLHAPAAMAAERLFAERFAAEVPILRTNTHWLAALQRLARRIEAQFIERLPALVAPGGRIFLSETVQTCLTELAADGAWTSAGTYRMTATLDLADYLDCRLAIVERSRWTWVSAVPEPGRSGKLFDVQGLILAIAESATQPSNRTGGEK